MTKRDILSLSLQEAVDRIENEITRLLMTKERVMIAIDGRCAAGKTTLAKALAKRLSCVVVACDDFFLPPEKRTEERLLQIGGNMDRERLLAEVLLPLREGKAFLYRRFDCHTFTYLAPVKVTPTKVTLIEGSYSCHDDLWDLYDLHIFLDVDKNEQRSCVLLRNKDRADAFFEKWIPLEERYFAAVLPSERAEITLTLTKI